MRSHSVSIFWLTYFTSRLCVLSVYPCCHKENVLSITFLLFLCIFISIVVIVILVKASNYLYLLMVLHRVIILVKFLSNFWEWRDSARLRFLLDVADTGLVASTTTSNFWAVSWSSLLSTTDISQILFSPTKKAFCRSGRWFKCKAQDQTQIYASYVGNPVLDTCLICRNLP